MARGEGLEQGPAEDPRNALDNIGAFEVHSGSLIDAVPERFRHLGIGRLYDMALGPRDPG